MALTAPPNSPARSPALRDTISVSEILDSYEHWGVPHFQRGSVWGEANTAALLESLYHDTPCGSIILWTPEDISEHGVPLVTGNQMSHLIIDGQQRTRSVYAAFHGSFESTEPATDETENGAGSPPSADGGDTGRHYWAINLNELSDFDGLLHKPEKRALPFFAAIRDPAKAEEKRRRKEEELKEGGKTRWNVPESPYKYNFVPMHFFGRPDLEVLLRSRQFFLKGATGTTDWVAGPELARVIERLRHVAAKVEQMKQRRLFLKELDRRTSLDDALRVFIRINSGGRPVQEEEKGYSILVGQCPSTATRVSEIFRLVQGHSKAPHGSDLPRDEALERMNERQFGFKLFIRVFVLAVTYHTDRAMTARGLSFPILHDRRFLPALERDNELYDRLWSATADAVVAMRRLLKESLKLDAIRFLPDTTSLLPLFLCLIRYPGLLDNRGTPDVALKREFRAGLARIALLLLLKEPTKQQLMKWTAKVATTHDCDASGLLDQLQEEVALTHESLTKALENANSLTNRYTLLLYAMERSRRARDFDYGINELKGKAFECPPRELAEDCNPEKQHIIPYSDLIDAYDLEWTSRVSTTVANNIGNITYISAAENSLEGLADRIATLDVEDDDNRRRHFIDKDALEAFTAVKQFLTQNDDPEPKEVRKRYEEWIKQRRVALARGFANWADELGGEWLEHVGERKVADRVEPVTPWLATPTKPYALRTLDLPNRIEDELIRLFESDDWQLVLNKDGQPTDEEGALTLCLKRKGRQVVRGVRVSPRHLTAPGDRRSEGKTIQFSDGDAALESLRALPEYFEACAEEEIQRRKNKKKDGSTESKRPGPITREQLLASIDKTAPGTARTAEALLGVATKIGGYVSLGSASASVKVRNAATRKTCTLFVVTRDAKFYIDFLSHWQENAKVPPDFRLQYSSSLTQILGTSPLEAAVPLTTVARHLDEVLVTVRDAGRTLRAAEPAALV